MLRPEADAFNHKSPFKGAVSSAKKLIEHVREKHVGKENKLTLMAHSFSLHYVIELLTIHNSAIDELILFAPAFDIHSADLNILRLAAENLRAEGATETSQQISKAIPNLKCGFNQDKQETFLLASQYTALFSHYWRDKGLMQRYFSYLIKEYSFNLEEMLLIRKAMPETLPMLDKKIDIPTKIYFGTEDPVTKRNEQVGTLSDFFTNAKVFTFENCGHYPQLEKMKEIFN